ncbi:MAG: hypothetical protein ACJ8GW_19795 [Massilia sp.]
MPSQPKDRSINTDNPQDATTGRHLPHERDESPTEPLKQQRGVMKQAADDLAQGLVDTDLRGMRGQDAATTPAPGASGQARPHADAGKK